MNKKVSVALATYNGEKFILKQLESLLHQSYKIDEVIICDDKSTDRTVDVILKYIEENNLNWKIYINESNLGYKMNFYNALKQTTSDIIFLCDQDDIWHRDKIKDYMNIFNDNTQIKCINSSFECIDSNNRSINSFSFMKKTLKEDELFHVLFEDIVVSNIAMGCTMAFSKDIKDIYLQNSTCKATHDWEINAIAAISNGLYFYNKPLIQYRIHNQNTTGIDVINNNDRMNNRIKNSLEIDCYLNSLSNYDVLLNDKQREYLNKYKEFSKKRMLLLKEKQTKNWFYLIKNLDIYKQYVSKKGMLIELYLSLK